MKGCHPNANSLIRNPFRTKTETSERNAEQPFRLTILLVSQHNMVSYCDPFPMYICFVSGKIIADLYFLGNFLVVQEYTAKL
jgi:hypothetical protein